MSPYTTAAIVLAFVALSSVVNLVIAALASVIDHPPGEAMTAAGHRAVGWVSLTLAAGLVVLLVMERLA